MAQRSVPQVMGTVVEVSYPERLSRLHLLLKTFFGWLYVGIPHGIILYLLQILQGLAVLVALVVILFTGQYPRGLFDFVVGVIRWNLRVQAYLQYFMVDVYPPFSMEAGKHPVTFSVEYPQTFSRPLALVKFLFGWLYVGIPHGVILAFYAIAVAVVLFISWFAILFTGKYPRGLFDLVTGFMRWSTRVTVYLTLLRDEYPPFSSRP